MGFAKGQFDDSQRISCDVYFMRLNELLPPTDSHVVFQPGQTIFREGDPGDYMLVLLEGTVEVQVHGRVIGAFAPIEIFGEMAVIDPQPRSATVIAKTDCKLARLNKNRFLILVQHKPEFALHIMQMLVERIRWMDSAAAHGGSEQHHEVDKLKDLIKELKIVIETQQEHIESLQQKLDAAQPAFQAVS